MKQEKKIQDYNSIYSFLLKYVNWSFLHAYNKVEYLGLDKIPKDGAIIFAPNHTNALMDALAVLAVDNERKVFVSRADIFRDPKNARFLNFLKIMPIMRVRDGLDEVRKNDETIGKAIDVLKDGVPFCILPEGTHRSKHSLLPLCKGIFRIALSAEEELKKKNVPLYIVPVGIEYGNFYRFRSSLLVQIGDPIDVSRYDADQAQLTHGQLLNEMREDLTAAMKEVILYIPADERYDDTYEICAAVSQWQAQRSQSAFKKDSLKTKYNANRVTLDEIARARQEKPEQMDKLFQLAEKARTLRLEKKISLKSVAKERTVLHLIWQILVLIITAPFTLPEVILSLPVSGIDKLVFSKMKDRDFYNSVRYGINLVFWPILWLIYAIIGFCILPWQIVLPLIIALLPATMISQDVYRSLRLLISDIRYMSDTNLKNLYNLIRKTYHEIL